MATYLEIQRKKFWLTKFQLRKHLWRPPKSQSESTGHSFLECRQAEILEGNALLDPGNLIEGKFHTGL